MQLLNSELHVNLKGPESMKLTTLWKSDFISLQNIVLNEKIKITCDKKEMVKMFEVGSDLSCPKCSSVFT